jgi:ribonuclease P protein component
LILYSLKAPENTGAGAAEKTGSAVGVTASKKVGKSVRRNRLRRLVKENYRFFEADLRPGHNMVFVVRRTEQTPLYGDIRADMRALLKRAGLVREGVIWESQRSGENGD